MFGAGLEVSFRGFRGLGVEGRRGLGVEGRREVGGVVRSFRGSGWFAFVGMARKARVDSN